jgi:hypothetical protein
MRALTTLVLGAALLACTGDDDGSADGGMGSGSNDAAWSDGPAGHLYLYSGPLYDIDAHDGRILRQLAVTHPVAMTMQADAGHAYFTKFDDGGNGRTWTLGTASDDITQISSLSFNPIGVYGRELVGQINESKVVRLNLDTGVDTQVTFPGTIACQQGDLFEHTLYLACMQITAAGTDAGMLTYDLDASAFGPFVIVKPGAMTLALASNVTGTPAGAMFTLYEGQAQTGTRTVYKITGTTVSAGVLVPGNADDLDQQAAIGTTIYTTMYPDRVIVPFDATTMTAGAPIAIDRPRYLRAGGGQLFASSHGHDGQLAKIDPATGMIEYRAFTPVVSTEIDSLAYGE